VHIVAPAKRIRLGIPFRHGSFIYSFDLKLSFQGPEHLNSVTTRVRVTSGCSKLRSPALKSTFCESFTDNGFLSQRNETASK